jgi:hypothetical protein
MSIHVKLWACAALIAGVIAAPGSAVAQHHHGGGHHGGGHYGGSYHGGHRGGYRGGWGGGGIYLGFGYPGFYGDPYYYADPYYYDEPPPDCDWEQVRVWRHGRWVWRDVRRCY